jgi:hypothetical protein
VLYRLRPHLLVGGEFSYLEMGASDRLPYRGLAFYSHNGLGTAFLRFDLLPDESVFSGAVISPPAFQLYLQAGAGLLLYDPKTYQGIKRPDGSTSYLPTERNDYPAMAAVAPVGAGLSVRITDQIRAGLEGSYYFTTTDHLGFFTVQLKLDLLIVGCWLLVVDCQLSVVSCQLSVV